MAATNIILGYGETLTHLHKLNRGSGPKKYPYLISEQRPLLGEQLGDILKSQRAQDASLKPMVSPLRSSRCTRPSWRKRTTRMLCLRQAACDA